MDFLVRNTNALMLIFLFIALQLARGSDRDRPA